MIIQKSSKGKPFDLVQLANDEALPDDIINGNKTVIVQQGVNFFYFKPSFFFTSLAPVPTETIPKIVEKRLSDCLYKSDSITIFKNNYSDFTLPIADFRYIMKYFQMIYDEHKTEAGVLLMVHPETKQWRVFIPIQVDCSGGGVNYLPPKSSSDGLTGRTKELYDAVFEHKTLGPRMLELYEEYSKLQEDGWCLFGTIHSHCNFGAFHSGVDDNDEINFEGLHITIGNVRSGWSYAARFMLEGVAITSSITDILKVETMEEVEKDIDQVSIFQTDMDLIEPSVGTRRKIVWQGGSSGSSKTWGELFQPRDDSTDKTNWLQEADFGQADISNDSEDEVLEEDMVRLFRFSDGKVILVNHHTFTKNLGKFNKNDYEKLESGEVSNELLAESLLRQEQLKEDEKSYDSSDDDEDLYLFNNDVLNPSSNGNPLEIGELIDDIQEYCAKNRKKAKKKGT